MANECYFQMKVTGTPGGINEFEQIIGEEHPDVTRQLSRVYNVSSDEVQVGENNVASTFFSGECAWSVHVCMLEGLGTYYHSRRNRYNEGMADVKDFQNDRDLSKKAAYIKRKKEMDEAHGCTSVIQESKRLELTIEIFSEESGEGFQEHYVIKNGEVIVSESVDIGAFYPEDFDTVEEFNKCSGLSITQEQFEYGERFNMRGFDWEFDAYKEENN